MAKNEVVSVLKSGIPMAEHECHWVTKLNYDTPEGVTDFKRICSVCGKVEHVTQTKEIHDFDSLYDKFHG